MTDKIRTILERHARLSRSIGDVGDTTDLYGCGLTSQACVSLMLALEDAFDVEFPDRLLRRSTFESIASIRGALDEIRRATSTAVAG